MRVGRMEATCRHTYDSGPAEKEKKKYSPLLPVCMQSTPSLEFFSLACRDLMFARVSMGLRPEFSASAMGTQSSASAKARIAYCSRPGLWDDSQTFVCSKVS